MAKKSRQTDLTDGEKQILRKLGLRLNRELHERGKSVEELAIQIRVAESTLREIIAGRSNPRILTVQAIALGLGFVNVCDFLEKLDQ